MSYPPPPGQSPYPPTPPQGIGYGAPTPALRGRKPLRIGLILFVVGLALTIVGGVVVNKKSLSTVDDFSRVSVATGTGTATFDKTGNYVAYYEASNINDNSKSVPAVGVAIKSPSGTISELTTPYGGRSDNKVKILTYEHNGHNGIALYQFKITEAGTYQVQVLGTAQTAPDADIAFGKSIAGGLAIGAALVIPGVLLLIAGVVLVIVGLVKRSRHKKQIATGTYGYGAPPQYQYPPQNPYPAENPHPPQNPYPPQQGYPPQPPTAGWQPPQA